MADNNFRGPPREKIALDNTKLKLSAPTPGVQGKYSSLGWTLIKNNPRITVYTNDPNDQKDYGKIQAPMGALDFMMLMNFLNQAIDAPGEFKRTIDNKNFVFPGGKRSDAPIVVSQTHVGKTAAGIVYISVTAKDRPKIMFSFAPSDFHIYRKNDGAPLEEAEASVMWARGYARLLENIMTIMLADNYTPPEPPQGGGSYGGGQGGGQRGGGNFGGGGGGFQRDGGGQGGGGGGGSNDDIKDNDLPF